MKENMDYLDMKLAVMQAIDIEKLRKEAIGALDALRAVESQLALSRGRESELRAQVERQMQMIDNLERTLYKGKK
jgi:hypothetical protein